MKTFAKIIIIIAVFFSGFYFGRHKAAAPACSLCPANCAQQADSQNAPAQANSADLKINFGNGDVKEFGGVAVKENGSVFDLLKETSEKNNVELKYKDYGGDLGVLVESIGGIGNDSTAGKYWQFWVNGEYSNIGASGYQLKNGDRVEWKFAEFTN